MMPRFDEIIVDVTTDEQGRVTGFTVPVNQAWAHDRALCGTSRARCLYTKFTPATFFGQPATGKTGSRFAVILWTSRGDARYPGILPQKLGQHFLKRASYLERIAAAAAPRRVPLIIEIGAGQGALTEHLLQRTDRLIRHRSRP
jgi:hypothetical protein